MNDKTPQVITFESRAALAAKVASVMEAQLAQAICAYGTATLAVSGGSTPKALHEQLSQRALRWRDVTTVLVDDRWVPLDHPGSNERFVIETLRRNKAAHVPIVGLHRPGMSAYDAVSDVAHAIEQTAPRIDVLHLGLGIDGHTASWFPHAEGLKSALAPGAGPVAAITAKPSAVTGDLTERMTFTLETVKQAEHIYLLITGADKRAALEAALEPGLVEDMPVRAILSARPDMWICWAP